MKFSCDQCDAQYMISDEKVGPNGVKVRCKKCSHVILVRRPAESAAVAEAPVQKAPTLAPPGGNGEQQLDAELGHAFDAAFGTGAPAPEAKTEAEAQKAAPDLDATQAASPEEAAAMASRSAPKEPASTEWYVAIGQAQVGPLPLAEVRRKWEGGDVGPDSLVWRPGMGDWAPLSGVEDLASYLAPVTRPASRAQLQKEPAPAVVAQKVAAPAAPAQVTAPASEVAWKPVGASALAALASEEISQQASDTAPEQKPVVSAKSIMDGLPDGGGVDPTGAIPLPLRALETTGEQPVERKSQVARGAEKIRKQRSATRTLLLLVVVLLAVVVAGGGYVFKDKLFPQPQPAAAVVVPPPAPPLPAPPPAPQAAPQQAAAPAPAPAEPPAEKPAAAPAAAEASAPPPAPEPAQKPAAAPEPERKRSSSQKGKSIAKAERTREAPPKAAPQAKPEPAQQASASPAPPPKKKGADLLDFDSNNDAALDEALGAKGNGRSVFVPPAPGGGGALPQHVTDSQVNETIMTRVSALQQCLAENKSSGSGVLKMRWGIAPDGSVQDLKCITPEHAATPFAACVSGVLKGLKFPKSVEGRSEVTFPFKF